MKNQQKYYPPKQNPPLIVPDLERFANNIEPIEIGFSRALPGGKIQINIRWSKDIPDNFAHEIGHRVLDYQMSLELQKEWREISKEEVSKVSYGWEEEFAGTFAIWFSPPRDGYKYVDDLPKSYQEFMMKYFGPPIPLPLPLILEPFLKKNPPEDLPKPGDILVQANHDWAIVKVEEVPATIIEIMPAHARVWLHDGTFVYPEWISRDTESKGAWYLDFAEAPLRPNPRENPQVEGWLLDVTKLSLFQLQYIMKLFDDAGITYFSHNKPIKEGQAYKAQLYLAICDKKAAMDVVMKDRQAWTWLG